MIYRIVIPNWRPSNLNAMHRVHWAARGRMKRADREMIAAYAKLAETPWAKTKRRVSMEITITGRQQSTDPDALWKSTLDGLVACGLLEDDSAEWCELGGVSHTRGDKTETIIVLEDILA